MKQKNMNLLFLLPICCLASCGSASRSAYQPDPVAHTVVPHEPVASAVPEGRTLTRQEAIPQLQIDATQVYRNMISYMTPAQNPSEDMTVEHLTAFIDYPAASMSINPQYGRNNVELEKLNDRLSALLGKGKSRIYKIRLKGYASPDGREVDNERLAGGRVLAFKKYLMQKYQIKTDRTVEIAYAGEDWDGLVRLVEGKPYGSKVTSIIRNTPGVEQRKKELQALDKGAVFKTMQQTLFAKLRRIELEVVCNQPLEREEISIETLYNTPEKVSLSELFGLATYYRPGTEQYREVYEIAAYRYPESHEANLNAGAAALAQGDREAARYFLEQVKNIPESYNNWGVLCFMEGNMDEAVAYFRKSLSLNPRRARANLRIMEEIQAL